MLQNAHELTNATNVNTIRILAAHNFGSAATLESAGRTPTMLFMRARAMLFMNNARSAYAHFYSIFSHFARMERILFDFIIVSIASFISFYALPREHNR